MNNETSAQNDIRDYRMAITDSALWKLFDARAMEVLTSLTQRQGKFATFSFVVYIHENNEAEDNTPTPTFPSFVIVTPEPAGAVNA